MLSDVEGGERAVEGSAVGQVCDGASDVAMTATSATVSRLY